MRPLVGEQSMSTGPLPVGSVTTVSTVPTPSPDILTRSNEKRSIGGDAIGLASVYRSPSTGWIPAARAIGANENSVSARAMTGKRRGIGVRPPGRDRARLGERERYHQPRRSLPCYFWIPCRTVGVRALGPAG